MASSLLITVLASSLVSCEAPRDQITFFSETPRSIPIGDWPAPDQERPEAPHVPHEEQTLRITAESGVSGTLSNVTSQSYTYSYTSHPAWLQNDLTHKLELTFEQNSQEEVFERPAIPRMRNDIRPQLKPMNARSIRRAPWARSRR